MHEFIRYFGTFLENLRKHEESSLAGKVPSGRDYCQCGSTRYCLFDLPETSLGAVVCPRFYILYAEILPSIFDGFTRRPSGLFISSIRSDAGPETLRDSPSRLLRVTPIEMVSESCAGQSRRDGGKSSERGISRTNLIPRLA